MPGFPSSSAWRSTSTGAGWTRWPALLAGYPFDVLLGSVHWLDAWRFDDIDVPLQMDEWSARQVDDCWEEYTLALEELAESGACDVLAHPDLIKVAGYVPDAPAEWWDRMAEAAASSGMAAELSSAGWRKPVGEQYPALPLLERFAARGVPFTTASDAHRHEHVADRAAALRGLLDAVGVDTLQAYRGRVPHQVAVGSPPARERRGRKRCPLRPSWRSPTRSSSPKSSAISSACSAAGASWPTSPSRTCSSWSRCNAGAGQPAPEDPELVVLGQMRPNNRPTLVDQDLVGQKIDETQWALAASCLHSGEIVRGSIHHPILGEQVPVENIPVRFGGAVIAVMLRVSLAPLEGPDEHVRADLPRRVRAAGRHGGPVRLPLSRRGRRHRGGAPGGRRRGGGRRRRAGGVRLAQRHERLSPHGYLRTARGPSLR